MKILIIRFSSLGDIVLTEPLVRFMRNEFPNCEIDYVTKPMYSELVAFFEGVNEVVTSESLKELISKVRRKRYDLVIDLHGKLKSIIISLVSKSEVKVKYDKKRKLRKKIVKKKKDTIKSTVALYFSALEGLGLPRLEEIDRLDYTSEHLRPIIEPQTNLNAVVSKSKIDYYSQTLSDLNKRGVKNIALFPGALHKTKQYPAEKLAELIRLLPVDKYRFFILGSPSEVYLGDQIFDYYKSIKEIKDDEPLEGYVINWCGEFSISELITMMSKFDLLITNDSGPMHISAALGKKQIALFGATSPKLGFQPHNKQAIIVQEELPCRPCSLHGGEECPKRHFKCMNNIDPQRIAAVIDGLYN